jgi:excisionase family DNA binding protein
MQSTEHHPPKLAYSIKEACLVSSLGRTTIYNHIAENRLRAVRVGGRTLIPADSLHALVNGKA